MLKFRDNLIRLYNFTLILVVIIINVLKFPHVVKIPFYFLTLQGNEIIHRLQSELRTSKSKVKYSFLPKSYTV